MATDNALRVALRRILGPNWLAVMVLIVAFLLWPIVWFRSQVTFAPDRFVEEWIKTVMQGLVIFALLEVLRSRQELLHSHSAASHSLRRTLLNPLIGLHTSVEAYSNDLRDKTPIAAEGAARILADFAQLRRGLSEAAEAEIQAVSPDGHLQSALGEFDVVRTARLIAAVCPGGRLSPTPVPSELKELVDRCRALHSVLTQHLT